MDDANEIAKRNKAALFSKRAEAKKERSEKPAWTPRERPVETEEQIEERAAKIGPIMYKTFREKWIGNPMSIEVPKNPEGYNYSKEVVQRVIEGFEFKQPALKFDHVWDREERTRLVKVTG